MPSQRVVDLRGKRLGSGTRSLSLDYSPKRRPPLRERRRKVRALIALFLLCLLGAGAYGVSYLSYLPEFTVGPVVVSGAQAIRPEAIQAFVRAKLQPGTFSFLSQKNIFLYPREEIEKALVENFLRVRSAKVYRESMLATPLVVEIEERVPHARWCTSADHNECYLMDDSGFIFALEEASSSSEMLVPQVFFGEFGTSSPIGERYLSGRLPGMLSLIEKLGQAGYAAKEVRAQGEQDFEVVFEQGFMLRASFGAPPESLVENLALVLASDALKGKEGEIEYVDLRFGNKVYYKLRGEDSRSAQ